MSVATEPICVPKPAEQYHADKSAWSRGMLWDFRERRSICHARHILGTAPEKKSTRKMDIGDVAHVALLEPEKLATHYVTFPDGMLSSDGGIRTNAAKDWKAEKEAAGRVVLKESEFAIVEAMVSSVAKMLGRLLQLPSKVEHAIYWTDPTTDVRCKCRPDLLVVTPQRAVIIDIKTTGDASPTAFKRRVENEGYWLQDVHYSAGVRETFHLPTQFLFVAVETEWPHECGAYEIDHTDVVDANIVRNQLLCDVALCQETGDWRDDWTQRITTLNLHKRIFSMQG